MDDRRFVVRVYGIYIDPVKGLLVSDELVKGHNITKLPGGGLEHGEGTIECLEREMLEEAGTSFTIGSHFYTTDFFVESAFDSSKQVISVYYFMEPAEEITFEIAEEPFRFHSGNTQSFRFLPIEAISAGQFTLPIDKHVAILLEETIQRILH